MVYSFKQVKITLVMRNILFFLGIVFLVPAHAAASEGSISVQTGILILLAQTVPMFHFILSKKLNPCYKTGYCMLYLAVVGIAWLSLIFAAALFPGINKVVLIIPLLIPFLFWIYTFTLGKEIRETAGHTCEINHKKQ